MKIKYWCSGISCYWESTLHFIFPMPGHVSSMLTEPGQMLLFFWCTSSNSIQHAPTFNPKFNSFRERLISLVRMFIRSHSWKATTTYGVFSAAFAMISTILKGSGSRSMISSSTAFTCYTEGQMNVSLYAASLQNAPKSKQSTRLKYLPQQVGRLQSISHVSWGLKKYQCNWKRTDSGRGRTGSSNPKTCCWLETRVGQ